MTRQTKQTASGERHWEVDLDAAAIQPWAARAPALLAQEVAEMAVHFPHWLLCVGQAGQPRPCPRCGDLLVCAAGAVRCAACAAPTVPAGAATLLWIGHLPTPLRDSARLTAMLPTLARAGVPTIEAGTVRYLLVPLVLAYPDDWPHLPPLVRYPQAVLHALKLPSSSAAHHLVGDGAACLYGAGDWRAVTARVVLQQRVVNHLASLVKIAAGMPPSEAFIGRQHRDEHYDR